MANKVAICLFRNDLRYHDNEVLAHAHSCADYVLPVYCFDPRHYQSTYHFNFPKTGAHRVKYVLESVTDLRQTLRGRGSDLMIVHGKPEDAITRIHNLLKGSALSVICQSEVTKEETDVENQLQKICRENRSNFIKIWGSTLYHKSDIPFSIKTIPDNYTSFRKDVEFKSSIRPEIVMPQMLKPLPKLELSLGDLPSYQSLNSEKPHPVSHSAFPFSGGETAGLQRLKSYLWDTDAVAQYKQTRNGLVGAEYSTKFSPWLSLGSLSPRRIHWEIEKYERERTKNDSTYWVRFELLWRDYFKFVTMKYGDRIFYPFGMKGKRIAWKKDKELFQAWQMGKTGVPFVDANMRELLSTGWMSNRGRQNVASFLVKDLHLDWRLGAEWFESTLLDHDVCSNYGNWNYVAGIGNDPREDRKFNMIKQSMDYDPEGIFIRQWVPELQNLPGNKVHSPWILSLGDLSSAKINLGENYPKPVVVAPEWSRHQKAKGTSRAGPLKTGNQRGIDFYFKHPDGKKK